MMTDAEVIRYLGTAGQNVCGRFAPEQLGRDIELAGRRRKGNWWQWLVAGLLVTAEARGQATMKGEVMKVQVLDTVRVVGYGVEKKRDVVGAVTPVPNRAMMAGEPGVYEVGLFSSGGELVQQRKIEVGGKEQVDLLGLPPALPAGMYFLRAARPDGAKVITLRIILI